LRYRKIKKSRKIKKEDRSLLQAEIISEKSLDELFERSPSVFDGIKIRWICG